MHASDALNIFINIGIHVMNWSYSQTIIDELPNAYRSIKQGSFNQIICAAIILSLMFRLIIVTD